MNVQGKQLKASMLDNYITCTRSTVTEDDFGDLTETASEEIAVFWGHIEELKSKQDLEQGKKRLTRQIMITARERDTDLINLDDEITFGNSTDIYQINDYFESDWKAGRTIIAEFKD